MLFFSNSEGFDFNPFHVDLRGQGGAARGLQPRALILGFFNSKYFDVNIEG
jgi:hypothetical protein